MTPEKWSWVCVTHKAAIDGYIKIGREQGETDEIVMRGINEYVRGVIQEMYPELVILGVLVSNGTLEVSIADAH